MLSLCALLRFRSKLRTAAGFRSVLCLAVLCTFPVRASEKSGPAPLRIHRVDGTIVPYRAYPEKAVNMLFPTGEAVLEPDANSGKWTLTAAPILKKIQIFKVSDKGKRFNVVGVSFGDQLFIFDQIFSGENSIAMSKLISVTASAPHSEAQAQDLAMLYLALAYYRFDDPARFIAYRSSASTKETSSGGSRTFSDMAGIRHSPQTTRKGSVYSVDFYAYDARKAAPTKVSRWRINVSADNFDECLSAHHEGFREPYSATASKTEDHGNETRFAPALMANGSTDDGATTDIQLWESSDGPGVQRVHFYYKSHEKTEKRMQDFFQNAVVVVERDSRTGSDGNTIGTQALLVMASDKKELFAVQLFEDESSVLEFLSASISSLLATRQHTLPAKQK